MRWFAHRERCVLDPKPFGLFLNPEIDKLLSSLLGSPNFTDHVSFEFEVVDTPSAGSHRVIRCSFAPRESHCMMIVGSLRVMVSDNPID
jgi:hypothetical protein